MKIMIKAMTRVEVKTIIEVDDELGQQIIDSGEVPEDLIDGRDITICVHGSEDYECEEDWRFVETTDLIVGSDITEVEEYE